MVIAEQKDSPSTMKTNTTLILCRCDGSLNYNREAFESHGFDDVIVTDQLCGNDLDVGCRRTDRT